jgi:hypothetical protein
MIASTAEARSVTIAALDAADRTRATLLRALCAVRPLCALVVDRQPGPITPRAQQSERACEKHRPPASALSEVAG